MRLSKDIVDKPIISINDGRIVGEVKDVMLTSDLKALAGIFIGREGLIRRKRLFVTSSNVVVYGIDAILVTNADVVTDNKQMPESDSWVRLSKLQGREVDTPGGTRVGTVGDVVLDEEGAVIGFALSRVYVEGPIADQRIIYQHAVIDNGDTDGVMTVDIERAERGAQPLPTPVPAKPAEPPAKPAAPAPLPIAEPEPEPLPEPVVSEPTALPPAQPDVQAPDAAVDEGMDSAESDTTTDTDSDTDTF